VPSNTAIAVATATAAVALLGQDSCSFWNKYCIEQNFWGTQWEGHTQQDQNFVKGKKKILGYFTQ
jgi:hypothetical protein